MSAKSVDPHTGRQLAVYREHTRRQVESAVARAHRAFLSWRQVPVTERAKRLRRLAQLTIARADEFARLAAMEMGKPVSQGKAEAEKCAAGCEFYARHARAWLADEHPPEAPRG